MPVNDAQTPRRMMLCGIIRHLRCRGAAPNAGFRSPAKMETRSPAWHRVCNPLSVRKTLIILAGFLMAGCASDKPVLRMSTTQPVVTTAAALAFDPPITLAEAPVNISRDDRGAAALVGFDESSTTYYGIYSDNRQADDGSDRIVRDSVSFKEGQTSR
jgi:hypothetical protein